MMNRGSGFAFGRRIAGAAVLALVMLTTACATINYDASTIQNVVSMNRVAPPASYEVVGEFESNQRPIFVIAQLLTVRDADLEDAIQRQLQRSGGDAVLNLRIHEEYDIIDFLVGAAQGILLFGANIVQTRSVSLRGDIVRWNTGWLENGGREWLAANCDAVTLEGTTEATAHICVRPTEKLLSPARLSFAH